MMLKKIFILLVLCFLYNLGRAQMVISAEAMNIVYRGLNNPISISHQGINNKKLIVKIRGGTITGENGKYEVRPSDSQQIRELEIAVFYKKWGKLKPLGVKKFRIKNYPVILYLGNLESGEYPKSRIKDIKFVNARPEGLGCGMNYSVHSFDITLYHKEGMEYHHNDGMLLDSVSSSLLSKAESGNTIIITCDDCLGPAGILKNKLRSEFYIREE